MAEIPKGDKVVTKLLREETECGVFSIHSKMRIAEGQIINRLENSS